MQYGSVSQQYLKNSIQFATSRSTLTYKKKVNYWKDNLVKLPHALCPCLQSSISRPTSTKDNFSSKDNFKQIRKEIVFLESCENTRENY